MHCCEPCSRFRSSPFRAPRPDLRGLPCVHAALETVLATGQPARAEYLTALGQWAGGCDGEVELRPHVTEYASIGLRDDEVRLFGPDGTDLAITVHSERKAL